MMKFFFLAFAAVMIVLTVIPAPGHATSDTDSVAFAKTAYASMLAIDQKDPAFAKKSLENFRALFDFDTFSSRCLTDITAKMSVEETIAVRNLFADVFFANFEKKTDSLMKRKIANPSYVRKSASPEYDIITISGVSSMGQVSFAFYLRRNSNEAWRITDIEVESVLLSRNWRGSFNKVFREKGYAGLTERLQTRLTELRSGERITP